MTDTLYAWSQTALDNQNSDASLSWLEGQPPEEVNDAGRAMMRRIAQLISDLAPKRTSAGTGNTYTVTSTAAGATYRDGEMVTFIVDRDNTAACTLNVNARGAKAWRPAVGVDFTARSLLANVPVTAFYRSASDEFISPGTGYYVQQLASGVALQSITARLPQLGDLVVSYAATPGPGRIRLGEAPANYLKSDWPELNSYLSGIGYPFGSTATHFTLPAAAGYALRFAATSSAIDTAGARAAGSTQADQNKQTTIPATGITATSTSTSTSTTSGGTQGGGGAGNVQGGPTYFAPIFNSAIAIATTTTTTTTIGGSATLPGGDELRVKNVAYHLDVIASTALSAAQIAVFGHPYQWDTGTAAANPGAGRVRGNNATLASITELYVSTADGFGVDLATWLASRSIGSILDLSRVGAQANRLVLTVSGTPSSSTGYVTIPVTVGVAAGSLSNNAQMALMFGSAGVGATGAAGSDGGVKFAFESSTTMAAPAAGGLRFNNAAPGSTTAIAISNATAETGNPSVAAWISTWDDSTTTGNRGQLVIRKAATGATVAIFNVAGAVTDNTSWLTFSVTPVATPGSFTAADSLLVAFSRTGDKGADGVGTGDVVGPSPSVDGELALFNGTTGKLIKRSTATGLIKATAGVAAVAVANTDYLTPPSGTALQKANGGGALANATAGMDYAPATSGAAILKGNGAGGFAATTAGTDYLHPGTTSLITKGFTVTPNNIGTISSGTNTPDPALGNYQYMTNNGAHTLAVPASDCAIDILVTNGASAGTITISGSYTAPSGGGGDTYATTNANKYLLMIRRINSVSTYAWKALQ